ncbi:hypothetical protein NPIL_192111 [Nephila pilipes]|uniref:Uncharacterized protein n=1 Tax=Nephila pilipes TaxID=299642 RepID=A0A8X6NEP4_NEPPI|nr:hypothetical protein NPIL_192111 [Nephila pilipes]
MNSQFVHFFTEVCQKGRQHECPISMGDLGPYRLRRLPVSPSLPAGSRFSIARKNWNEKYFGHNYEFREEISFSFCSGTYLRFLSNYRITTRAPRYSHGMDVYGGRRHRRHCRTTLTLKVTLT